MQVDFELPFTRAIPFGVDMPLGGMAEEVAPLLVPLDAEPDKTDGAFGLKIAVPEAYRAAYLDLAASGGTPDRALKLFIRFVRPVSHVSKFTELQVRLSPVDDAGGGVTAGFVDITLTDLADAAGLEVNILGPNATAAWVSARGIKTELKATAIAGNLALVANSPGFLVKLAVKGGPGQTSHCCTRLPQPASNRATASISIGCFPLPMPIPQRP